jgi:hypothetical protein
MTDRELRQELIEIRYKLNTIDQHLDEIPTVVEAIRLIVVEIHDRINRLDLSDVLRN